MTEAIATTQLKTLRNLFLNEQMEWAFCPLFLLPDCINFDVVTNDNRKHNQRLKGCSILKKGIFIIIFTIAIIGLFGCQNNNDQNIQRNNVVDMNYTNEQHPDNIAKHLVNVASSVPDVNDATAIVIGRYAIIGIDVNKDIDRSRVGTIKYTVGEALKDDPYGVNAIVTADTDITERIRKVQQDMQDGRPIQGILEEMSEIVNRLMPETPGRLFEEKNKQPEKTNNQQLNEKEERELKNEQEKQNLDR